jgi:uroporphyrin-3 C-methyltransferase
VAEESETPKILEELSKSNAAKPVSRTSRKQKNARRRVAIIVILFVSLLVGVLFLGYQQQSLTSRLAILSDENQQLTQSLSAQSGQLIQLRENLLALPEPVALDDSVLRELQDSLGAEIQRLRQQLADLEIEAVTAVSEPRFGLKVQEAGYLLRMANQKLQLEADPTSAIMLLEQADTVLSGSENSNVFAARQSIAADLERLENIKQVDREEIFNRLGNLATQAETVDLIGSMRENFSNRRASEYQPGDIKTNTDGFIGQSLQFLRSVFIWQKWEETTVAMLAPGQDSLIKQNLRLFFEQSQLAMLMRDVKLYQRSLRQSLAWLQRYAVIDSESSQNIVTDISELSMINIKPDFPDLGQTLELVNQIK